MPRKARIHFVSLHSSLVNLPISIYGPLLERNIRPQNLAVHLTLVPPNSTAIRKEAYVGWTGMASASSLAQFNVSEPTEKGLETIEIDPQYSQSLGFAQGDIVEIGLLHDMAFAKSVATEPLTSDDWEIIEIHASHVESTLLSQVRVAKVGQEINVWVLGRTRVRLKIVSLAPQAKNDALLLSTNTEVSISPKLHANRRVHAKEPAVNGTADAVVPKSIPQPFQILRVLPNHVLSKPLTAYSGSEVIGYVSSSTLAQLLPASRNVAKQHTCYKVSLKRLEPPINPVSTLQTPETVPETKVLNPSEKIHNVENSDNAERSYVCGRVELIGGHIVFPSLPAGIEHWDLIKIVADSSAGTLTISGDNNTETLTPHPETAEFLAGVDDILKRCVEFCVRKIAIHSTKLSVPGVSSLLLTGRAGVGKTSIVKTVAKALQQNPKTYTYTHYVDVSPYADKPISVVKLLFRYWLKTAIWHKPSILVLDNLHELLGIESEQSDSFRTRHVTELFLSMFSSSARSASVNYRGIILLATAPSSAALHPLIGTAHVFEEVVNVTPPNKDARRDILAKIIHDRLVAANDLAQSSEAPINFTYLATQTEGYSATDLQDLASRTVHQVTMRLASENKPPIITMADFEIARADFIPLSLRDIKLEKSDVSWADIGGLHETRRILRETLEWPTKYGPIFAQSPLRLRSGLLLFGYPGCGKTLLASAVAKECGLNFIGIKGPEILNKYIGASEQTVRDIFERASSAKPCVLFFDEFDSIAPKRGHDSTGVTDRVVNQMLTQMDGAEGLDGVYVLAATSRPDLIDSALLRPGRLDKSLLCNMPDVRERKDILEAVSRKVSLAASVDLDEIAQATEGFSGADLQALIYNAHLEVVNAAIVSSPSGKDTVSQLNKRAIRYTTIGGHSKTIRSKAEESALQRKLQQIQAASQPIQERADDRVDAVAHKQQIMQDHIRHVLKTTKPSVSTEERQRLDKIYRAFMFDRGDVPSAPSDYAGVGNRSTLM
ncbi:P-loop containing nucleoside triphosphate hydrolase protein [Lentinula edodes]|uniref:P-loop containing nucleoside triphosphate hydrolase protein n=1 Tax=Lentinula edodes TaxID=5353 RepID=UPI001E8EBFCE|nr:P-loop containing nucleoside triphosphate hydrolase protein [Lentinula edodes]KAH7876793.1 P-loop containing nucleoside triphosphate hydrolase protein [Lentinula edodes]